MAGTAAPVASCELAALACCALVMDDSCDAIPPGPQNCVGEGSIVEGMGSAALGTPGCEGKPAPGANGGIDPPKRAWPGVGIIKLWKLQTIELVWWSTG